MDPEDKYNIKYYKILKNIKDKILLLDHNLVEYKVYSDMLIVGHDEPSQKEELIILQRIEKEGGIKIVGDNNLVYTGLRDMRLDFLVLQPRFDEIYYKYKNMNAEFNSKKQQKFGILNTGKNNTFIGNTFHGHDIGIKDEGEGTVAKANEFHALLNNPKRSKTQNIFEKITNNQTFAIIIGGLILLVIIYFIYTKFGVNLSQLR